VAEAPGKVGRRTSRDALQGAKLLKGINVRVWKSAALALRDGGKGAVGTIPDLCGALRVPAPTVRMTAATALGRIFCYALGAIGLAILRLPSFNIPN
jgi:hypothetical protein